MEKIKGEVKSHEMTTPLLAIGALVMIAILSLSVSSCQTKLLAAGAAQGQLAVRQAISEDNAKLASTGEELAKKQKARIAQYKKEQLELEKHVAELANQQATDPGKPICPTEEGWLALLQCSVPRSFQDAPL